MGKSEWVSGISYLCVLVMLAVAGHWTRREADPACAYDGGKIDPRHRVRVVDRSGEDLMFCCITCAEAWLRREAKAPRAVHVADESSGREVDAAAAFFVRSLVVTNRTTGNRIHAFRTESDAQGHARSFGGRLLDDAERPFADLRKPPCPDCVHD